MPFVGAKNLSPLPENPLAVKFFSPLPEKRYTKDFLNDPPSIILYIFTRICQSSFFSKPVAGAKNQKEEAYAKAELCAFNGNDCIDAHGCPGFH
jgi:hypothetical protein